MPEGAVDILGGARVLVTGAAGFIGSTVVSQLLGGGVCGSVVGFDSVNSYYDVSLKERRLARLADDAASSRVGWRFIRGDLVDWASLESVFAEFRPQFVVHLAAQAGVRHSVTHPEEYIASNVAGFLNVLEMCRKYPVEHLVYASSSSVYGMNARVPYREADTTDSPVSFYAATKKSDELFAHSYSSLYGIRATGVRIFTAYGPWGRPDMAYFSFAGKMRRGEDIELYNYGDCQRDFTYVDDVAAAIRLLAGTLPQGRPPCDIYNIGCSSPVRLMDFVKMLCECLKEAGCLSSDYDLASHLTLVPAQPGDVRMTYADVSKLTAKLGWCPQTALRDGLAQFARWYASNC